jgi:hypothetical protein
MDAAQASTATPADEVIRPNLRLQRPAAKKTPPGTPLSADKEIRPRRPYTGTMFGRFTLRTPWQRVAEQFGLRKRF